MSSDEISIRVRAVSKHYAMFARPEDRLKQMIVPRLQRALGRAPASYFRDFAALNGVSFDVRRGETVGIIGRNGSGKSTLLQIICGTLQPTGGSVNVNGRIAALLELGAGFNPEFSGRENVYLNAAILGLSRGEIDARFDSIARFADIGDFIDQPVKTYSSGMNVRLAFATAINVDPDILVVDEALAVGDEAFQRKCYTRIEDIKDKGGTILFVSHAAQTIVQLCDRAILVDAGEKILEGRPKTVVSQYQRLINLSGEHAAKVRKEIIELGKSALTGPPSIRPKHSPSPAGATATEHAIQTQKQDFDHEWHDPNLVSPSRVEFDSQGARIEDVRILTLDGRPVNNLRSGRTYLYTYEVHFDDDREEVGFGMSVRNTTGLDLAGGSSSFDATSRIPLVKGGSIHEVVFTWKCELNPGTYFVNAGTSAIMRDDRKFSHRILDACAFRVMPHNNRISNGWFNIVETVTVTEASSKKGAI